MIPSLTASLATIGQLLHSSTSIIFPISQALLAGLAALLVFKICRRLGFSRPIALLGGLAWGLYPAQIIASAHLSAETAAVCLTLFLVLSLSALLPRGRAHQERNLDVKDLITALAAGITMVLLLHLKPSLAPVVFVLIFLSALNLRPLRRGLTLFACFATGAFITLTPWLMFTQAVLNHCTLVPDQDLSRNLSVGLDTTSDGWAILPPPAHVPVQLSGLAGHELLPIAAMFARKAERLWRHHWNDFHCSSLGLPLSAQMLLHQMMLLGAGLGAVYLLVMERLLQNKNTHLSGSDLIKISALLMVAEPFCYVFVEAQARYAFTAMPWIVILTVIGLDHLEHTWHSRAVSASFILAMVLVIINRIELAPLLVKACGNIYVATSAVNLLLAIAFGVWLAACCRAAEAKRVGGVNSERNLNIFAWCIFALAFVICLAFSQLKEQFAPAQEWVCRLKDKQSVNREVTIDSPLAHRFQASGAEKHWALILVDGSDTVEKCSVSLNGVQLPALQSLASYTKADKEAPEGKIIADTAAACGIAASKIRQWRVAQAPLSAIIFAPDGKNIITITAGKDGALLYGQYVAGQAGPLPALSSYAPAKFGFDGDLRPIMQPQGRGLALLTKDMAPAAGEQNGEYRLFLLLGETMAPNTSPRDPLKRFADSYKIVL